HISRLESFGRKAEVHYPFGQPLVIAFEHAGGEFILGVVFVAPEVLKEPPHFAPRVAAEKIGQFHGPFGFRLARVELPAGLAPPAPPPRQPPPPLNATDKEAPLAPHLPPPNHHPPDTPPPH